MTADPAHLLKRLEPAVRPGPAPHARAPRQPLETQGFDDLLALVSTGAVRSDRPVEVRDESSRGLDAGQLERLAAAADVAEAAGARRALMLIDGQGLVMDVPRRAIESALGAGAEAPLVHLDAAVYVAGPEDAEADGAAPRPGNGLLPPAIARQMEAALRAAGAAPDPTRPDPDAPAAAG